MKVILYWLQNIFPYLKECMLRIKEEVLWKKLLSNIRKNNALPRIIFNTREYVIIYGKGDLGADKWEQ